MSVRPDVEQIVFVPATPELFPRIVLFLADAGLPTDDLSPANLSGFELALDQQGGIIGMAGLDVTGGDALLRSVTVAQDWRGIGLGECLVRRREEAARHAGVRRIYLLTETSDGFFRRLGYEDVARTALPASITAHAQFRSLCPASAKCLGKPL